MSSARRPEVLRRQKAWRREARLRRLLARLRLATGAACALLLATILFTPVAVQGPSMLPTLREGDILVTAPLWLDPPDRHDLVIFQEPDTGVRVVKRVAGLPGEELWITPDGDLAVNGVLYRREVRGVDDLIPLVDTAGAAADALLSLSESGFEARGLLWSLEPGVQASARLRQPPRDGYLAGGVLHPGERPAVDLGIEVEYRLEAEDARVELLIREGAENFLLSLARRGREVRLLRLPGAVLQTPEDPGVGEVLFEDRAARAPAQGVLFLSNADQTLTACVDGEFLFPPQDYQPPAPLPLAGLPQGLHVEQAGVGGRGPLSLGRIRVGRDVFLEPSGLFGCSEPIRLAEDEYFLLGDDPVLSRDSRIYGGVSRGHLQGVVVDRLWPRTPSGLGW